MIRTHNKIRIHIIFSLFTLLAITSTFLLSHDPEPKIKITTSIFPLQEFTRAIVGDRGEVNLLLPPGAEIHSWRPRPSDILKISRSDIFIYIGPSLEPWIEKFLKAINNPGLQILAASEGITLTDEGDEHAHHEESHSHESRDPHFWLDFEIDQRLIDRIEILLSETDPESKSYYMNNASLYKEKLAKLDQKYKNALQFCDQRTIILGGHAAFGYLSHRYNLHQISLYGLNPDSEPTPKQLTEVVDLAKKYRVEAIFFEEYVSDKLAKVIAKEIGANVLLLNPGSNLNAEQIRSGLTFIEIMEKNLENLKNGLNCR